VTTGHTNRAGYALLLRVLRERRGALLRMLLWSVVESLPSLLSGLLVAAAIDRFLAHDVLAGLGFLVLLLAAAAVGAVATRLLFGLLTTVVESVRDAFVVAVVDGAVAAATRSPDRTDTVGVVRLGEQVQTVREVMFSLLRIVRPIAFNSVAALAGLVVLAPVAGLISGVPLAAALILLALLLPGLAARHRAVLVAEEEVARRAGTAFGGVRDAIACGAQDRAVADVGRAVDDSVARARVLARSTAVRSTIVFLGAQLPVIVLFAAAPWLVGHGQLTFGGLVGAVTYLTVGLEPALRRMVEVLATWGLQMVVSLQRLGTGFAAAPAANPGKVPAPDRCDLTVRDLAFAYGRHAAPVVQGLDLTIPEGGHLAVVGPSGIGKSTLANLLVGLLTPDRGAVLLGGVDVRRIRETDLRRLLGLIPQEAYVFAGTLRENLAYLAPQADDRELADAAVAVGLRPVIDRLGGLDARVGTRGVEMSNGEKQLVALARAYLSPARVVILDEATSNLDPRAEALAERAFCRRGGTVVVIAHRISSARRADMILLLDGQSVHLGSHDELVRDSALYADLVGHWDFAPERRPAASSANRGERS
jgi:ATP-binding cassette subfamily C protein